MIDFVTAVAEESERFGRAADRAIETGVPMGDIAVPTCPDWDLTDLVWHLTEVQHFWASIVERGLEDPSTVPGLTRPSPAGLPELFDRVSEQLVAALAGHDPEDACWSWHDEGHSVGWVRRRQAHEALIHRLDAESALAIVDPAAEPEPIDEALATDGIDEMLTTMLEARSWPDGARWETDGRSIRIEVPARAWTATAGRIAGTEPEGRPLDLPAIRLVGAGAPAAGEPSATLRGPAAAVDRWLWRRGPVDDPAIETEGDRSLVGWLRQLAALD